MDECPDSGAEERCPFPPWQVRLLPILAEWEVNPVVRLMRLREEQLKARASRLDGLLVPFPSFGKDPPKELRGALIRIRITTAVVVLLSCGLLYPAGVMVFVVLGMVNAGKPSRVTGRAVDILSPTGYQRELLTELWLCGITVRDLIVASLLLGCDKMRRVQTSPLWLLLCAALPVWYLVLGEYRANYDEIFRFQWSLFEPSTVFGMDRKTLVPYILLSVVGIVFLRWTAMWFVPLLVLSEMPFAWAMREFWRDGDLARNSMRLFLKIIPEGVLILLSIFVLFVPIGFLGRVLEGTYGRAGIREEYLQASALFAGFAFALFLLLGLATLSLTPLIRWRLRHWYGEDLGVAGERFLRRVVLEDPDWEVAATADQSAGSSQAT